MALLARKTDANEDWVFPSARAESGRLETVQKQIDPAKRMAGLPESVVLYCARHRCFRRLCYGMVQAIDSRKVELVALPGIEPGFED